MIIVCLRGRLGNQMFQYAAGRSLAYRLGVSLGIDNFTNSKKIEHTLLYNFNIQVKKIPNNLLPPRKYSNRIKWAFWRLGLRLTKIFYQDGLGYNEKFKQVTKNTYLYGYWQSEKYFHECKEIIKSDFEFISSPKERNLDTYQELLETQSTIALHIRRGDYLKKKHLSIFSSCSQDYYEKAVRYITENSQINPNVFVFSDDPEWVYRNFKPFFPFRVINHNPPNKAIEDLRLMSVCKHHVIANSSFSWWGAWLGKNEKQIVIAPDEWFASPKYSNPDIYCKNWVRIKN